MAKRNLTTRIHMLSVREVVAAPDGIVTDGGGLILRIAGGRASWVFRYTSATGKRREMGFGVCHRQSAQMAYSPTSWFCILAGMGRFPRKPRKASRKHHASDHEQARKACLDMLRHFPDHRSVLDGMRTAKAPVA